MLSPALKNLSEEDSAGSDAESGQSLEPETDRFGFLVTSSSTAGNVGPAPELVRQREAKWIDIMGQWNHILLKKTSKVKVQCQKGIPASLRAKCWPLLCGATERMKKHEELYKFLDSQPALQSWVDVIERDLDRQFPFHEMFLSKDGHGQRGLFEVLKAYTQYKPNEGYCQAQGPVAAVLLMNMPTEEAFWCLVQICEQYLPGYYNPLLEGVLFDATLLMWVLKRTCPAVHKHLQQHGVEPLMFATDWLMCLFTRHLPFNTLLRVWDLFFCYGVRVLLQVAVVLVRRVLGKAEQRKQCQGQLETLERLRGVKEQVREEDDAFIAEVCAVPLSAKDLERKTEKELNKWRKDRPASTFDPRSRCLGYRMAWATTLHNQEEQEKEKMESGNLSVPLSRSSSTLSLAIIPNNKRRKAGKGNVGEWEGSGKVVRHVSMGAKDDCRNWSDKHFINNRDNQKEDVISKEYIKQNESVTRHNKQKETQNVDNIKNKTEEKGEEVREGIEDEKPKTTDKEIEQCKEPEEPVLLEQTRKINTETLPTADLTLEDIPQSTECTIQDQQGLDSDTLSEPMQQQTKDQTSEGTECTIQDKQTLALDTPKDPTHGQTEDQTSEGTECTIQDKQTLALDTPEDPTHGLTEDQTSKESAQLPELANQCQQGLKYQSQVLEEQKHHSNDEEKDVQEQSGKERADDDAKTVVEEQNNLDTSRQQETEVDVQQAQGPVVTEFKDETTEESCSNANKKTTFLYVTGPSGGMAQPVNVEKPLETGAMDGKHSSAEAPAPHACTEAEAHIQIVTDAAELTQQEDTEGKNKVTQDVRDDEAAQQYKEQEQEKTGVEMFKIVTENAEQDQGLTGEEQIQMDEEAPEAQQAEMISCEDENTEPNEKEGSENIKSQEEPACDEVLTTMGPNEKSFEFAPESTSEERDVFTSPKSPDANAGSLSKVQSQESPLMDEQHELKNVQTPSRRNSKSSGDFCIRRSSTSCSSKMGRRLSEDLFTVPHKPANQSHSTSSQQVDHDESKASPVDGKPTQSQKDSDQTQRDDLSQCGEVAEKVETQQESSCPQKRFGLFSRLKAEQPKRNKAKKRPKMQVPKILIQDFSDEVTGLDLEDQPDSEEKLSSRERRRRRREQERRLKEEERLRKKREKELEKLMQQERKKMQARTKGLQAESEGKLSSDKTRQAESESQTDTYVTSYAESYF